MKLEAKFYCFEYYILGGKAEIWLELNGREI